MVPAVLRQGALSISISTDGKSPMLARRIRERLEPEFGPEYCEFLELMGNVREYVIRTIPEEKSRKDTFQRLIDSDILDLLKDGQREKVKERITHVLGDSWTQS
jgi:precorrin-2 dehydrogenase/sirohydrochlorin ferrochelatase